MHNHQYCRLCCNLYVTAGLQVFCEVIYKAKSNKDIVAGIEEYAEDLTVLPPSVWDPSIRIEPPAKPVKLVCKITLSRFYLVVIGVTVA